MQKDVQELCKDCSVCIKSKGLKRPNTTDMGETASRAKERLSEFSIDFVSMPKAYNGAEYIMTALETTTRFLEAFPLRKITTEAVIKILRSELIPRYGWKFSIKTDNGSQFTSKAFQEACDAYKIKHHRVLPFSPESNEVERTHRELKQTLKSIIFQTHANPNNWPNLLPDALAAIRQSPILGTKYSPFFLMYGEHPVTVTEKMLSVEFPHDEDNYFPTCIRDATELVQAGSRIRHGQNQKRHDRSGKVEIRTGDNVLYKRPPPLQDVLDLGGKRKFLPKAVGPFQVVNVDDHTAVIEGSRGLEAVNKNKLIPVNSSDIALKFEQNARDEIEAEKTNDHDTRSIVVHQTKEPESIGPIEAACRRAGSCPQEEESITMNSPECTPEENGTSRTAEVVGEERRYNLRPNRNILTKHKSIRKLLNIK